MEMNSFSPALHEQEGQLRLVSLPGENPELLPSRSDPNPIIDVECPRSVGGVVAAVAICQSLGIPFELHPLDCEPFYHGYGKKCSEAQLTVGIWHLPVTDINGREALIPFYLTRGDGFLLLGNEILHQSY